MDSLKNGGLKSLRWLERYTQTDMVYLAKGSFWINANTTIVSIFSFLLSVSFARFVSKDVYGTYQFLISIASILGGLTLTGMNNAVTQAVARGFEGVFRESVRIQIRFGIISFLAGISVSVYYFINDNLTLSLGVLLISITLPFINSLNTWSSYLSGKKEFKNFFTYWQIVNFTYYIGLISTIFIFPNAIALIFVGFSFNAISNFLVYRLTIKKYKPNDQTEGEAISYGKKLSLSNILPTLGLHIDNIIVFHFLGPTQLALYAFASNIPDRLSSLLKPISNIAFPKLATKSQDEVSSILPKRTLQLFLFSVVAGLFYVVIAPLFFKIFFPQYIQSVIYSQVYAIAVVLSLSASLPITSLYATRSKNIYFLNTVHPIFSIGAITVGTFYFGIWGTVISKIISSAFLVLYSSYLVKDKNS